MSSISGSIAHRESSSMIPRIMWWSCTHPPELKVIKSQIFGSKMAHIHEIEPMDDKRAYLDRSLEIPMMEGYKEYLHDSLPHHFEDALPRTHGKRFGSQPCYNSGEGTPFNALEAQTFVGGTFVDVSAPDIDDQPIDEKTRTFISDDPEMVSYSLKYHLRVRICHHHLSNPC
uniref:Uncharacterized protein n=1 Tax=Cucumis melo TaxID=3656 RepID=A0A9I9DV56_CUCME